METPPPPPNNVFLAGSTLIFSASGCQPPGVPPAQKPQWSSHLFKEETWKSVPVLPDNLVDSGKVKISHPHGEDDTPCVMIEKDVVDYLYGSCKNSVVMKLLGRMVSFTTFAKTLSSMWQPQGGWSIVDLQNDYFMASFELEDDMLGALSGGPWSMFGHYLLVRKWDPTFDPMDSVITMTGVWVRISGLRFSFYEKNLLMAIGSAIGRPIRVDDHTLKRDRGRFARICIEVDLSRPLKGEVLVNGKLLKLEYENLHVICFACGCYGHSTESCKLIVPVVTAPVSVHPPQGNESVVAPVPVPAVKDLLGPWMIVARKSRPSKGRDAPRSDVAPKRMENPCIHGGSVSTRKYVDKVKDLPTNLVVPGADFVDLEVGKHRRRPGKTCDGPSGPVQQRPGGASSKAQVSKPPVPVRKPVPLSRAPEFACKPMQHNPKVRETMVRTSPGAMTFLSPHTHDRREGAGIDDNMEDDADVVLSPTPDAVADSQ